MNLSVADAASEAGETIAIIDGNRSITWAEVAHRLRAQTLPIRRAYELIPEISTASALAILSALENGVSIVLHHPKRGKRTAPAPDVSHGAIAIASSGSTGVAKLIVHRREALLAHAEASAAVLGSEVGDRWLICLPLAHVSGLAPLIRALASRRGVILEPTFKPSAIIQSIQEHRATLVSLVPTMLADLVEQKWRPPSHLRRVLVGGARCPGELVAAARGQGWPVALTYGMTETFSHIAIDGVPLPGVEVRTDESGALSIRSPAATSWPDWLPTGDLAQIDEDGCLHIIGRADEMIITGGENVAPPLVERALLAHPAIAAAAVIGLPDTRWGQIVGAVVVLADSANAGGEDALGEVAEAMCESLANFERPRRYAKVAELPRLANGKLDRLALQRLF